MPVYEYRCEDCKKHTEVHQSFTDDPLTECPNCGGPLKKVFGNVGIAFKGSGFYVNDSGSKKSSGSSSSHGEHSSNGSSESGAKSDGASETGNSKSEKKSEAKSKATSTAE